ncbi:mitochondrial fission process protein 1 [Pitangus sulphuratus]|nr:mitochondrial fission process protein 1 [Pitangus sulphuratus]
MDQEGTGGGVALYVRQHLEYIKLCLGVEDEQVKSLWVRIKGSTSKSDTVVGICYRPPKQEDEVDEAFYKQLEVVSESQALVLMGDFKFPDIVWRSNRVKHKQPKQIPGKQ